MPQARAEGGGREKKKKREPRPDTGAPAFTGSREGGEYAVPVESQTDAIKVVQRHTTDTVPTMVKMAIGGLQRDTKELIRAARLASRTYDMTPQAVLGIRGTNEIVSPITGEELTVQEVRRLAGSRLGALSVLNFVQQGVAQAQAPTLLPTGRVLQTGDPMRRKDVFDLMEVVGGHFKDEDIKISRGVAVALGLADSGVKAKVLNQNLKAVERWTAQGITGTWKEKLGIATAAAKNGVTLKTAADVARFIQPEVVTLAEDQRAELKSLGASESDIQKGLAYAQARAKALKNGTDLPPTPEGMNPQILGAIVGARDVRVNEEYIRTYTGDIDGYLENAQNLAEGLRIREQAWENSWLNRNIVSPAMDAMVWLDRRFFQPIAITGKEALEQAPGIGEMLQASTAARQALEGVPITDQSDFDTEQYLDDIHGAWQGKVRVSDTLVRDWNIPRWNAEAIEFAAGWYIDPLVVGGKALRAFTLRNINPQFLTKLRTGAVSEGKMSRFTRRVNNFVDVNKTAFSKAMLSLDDTEITKWADNFRAKTGQSPFDLPYLQRVRGEMKERGLLGRQLELEGRVSVANADGAIIRMPAKTAEKYVEFPTRLRGGVGRADEAMDELRESLKTRGYDPTTPDPLAETGMVGYLDLEYHPASGTAVIREGHHRIGALADLDADIPLRVKIVTESPTQVIGTNIAEVRAGLPDDAMRALSELGAPTPPVGSKLDLTKFLGKRIDPDLDRQLEEVLRGHFLPGAPTPGTLADIGFARRAQAVADARKALADTPSLPAWKKLVDKQNAKVIDEAIDPRAIVPPRLEIPSLNRPIPGMGFVKTIGNRFDTLVGDTRLGINLRKLPTMNPGGVLKVHDNPDRWFQLQARRAGFSADEVTDWQTRAAKAAASNAPEAELKTLVTDFQKKAMYLRARPFGITDQTADDLLETLQTGAKAKATKVQPKFGTFGQRVRYTDEGVPFIQKGTEPGAITDPVFSSELVNFLPTVDPIDMQRAISEYVGTARRFRAASQRALRKAPATINKQAFAKGDIAWLLNHGLKPFASLIMRTFKLQAVARPAYMFRVVLGDELLRSLAVNQSIFEQAMSYGWGLRKVTAVPPPDAGALTRAKSAIRGKLDEAGERRIQGQVIDRPGAIGRDPLANTQLDWSELAHESAKATERKLARFRTTGEYQILDPNAANHMTAWEHALNNVMPNSAAGRRALEAIARGEIRDQNGLTELLKNWSKTSVGGREMRRIGKTHISEVWANEAAETAWGYTMGNKHLAQMALMREVDASDLQRMFPNKVDANGNWLRPFVHGPRLTSNFGGGWHEWVNRWYGLWVRNPENTLNRQPFYSQFKQRAEATYARMGLDLSDPDIAGAVDDASRQFALAHSKRIMFDFTENSRIGELMGFAFPFMQPWQENISVWGHILTKRNPAMVGYINRVSQLGVNTGFIKKDPDTGEWVIPETWWMFTAPVLWMIAGREHGGGSPWSTLGGFGVGNKQRSFSLSAPVTSLNLFANSVFKVPDNAPLIGGLPLPAPGLYTPATWVLQKFTDEWAGQTGWRGSVHDYLFAFGPGSTDLPDLVRDTLLPRWMNKAIAGMFPGWDDEFINDLGNDYLRLQQYMGQDVDPDRALGQARQTAGYLAFTAAFFPAAVQIKYPHSWLETEYHDKIEEVGVVKARDYMLEKYPEYSLITIPKTMTTRIYNKMENGQEYLQMFGQTNPAPPGVRPVSSAYYEAIIKQPGFKEFANDPRTAPWAAVMMIQSTNPNADDFDPGAYAAQLARSDVRARAIEEVYGDYQEAEFWELWGPIEDQYDRGFYDTHGREVARRGKGDVTGTFVKGFQQIEAEGGYAGDNGAWDALARRKALELQQVASKYKTIDSTYTMPRAGGGYQFVFDSDGTWPEGIHPYVKESLRLVMDNEVVKDFPAVQGLREYWDLREGVRQKLIDRGIDGLGDAGTRKFRQELSRGTKDIISQYPEFEAIWATWFQNDLRAGLPTLGEDRVNKWYDAGQTGDEKAQAQYDKYQSFFTQYRSFSADIKEAKASGREDVSVEDVYQSRTEFINDWYRRDPKIVQTYYDSLTASQRRQQQQTLYTRPTAFYSRFDWKLMGVNLSSKAAKWLEHVQRENVNISAWSENIDMSQSTGDRRQDLSRYIAQHMGKDETFDKAIKAMGTWGWQAIAAGYTGADKDPKDRTRSEVAWDAIIDYANRWRIVAEEAKIHGDDKRVTFDDQDLAWYNNARDNVGNYLEVLRDWSPQFKREWGEMAEDWDGRFLEWLVPTVHFKLGQVDAY